MTISKPELTELATSCFGLSVDEQLPIGESFASEVIRFRSGRKTYVMKRPFTQEKAEREFFWLKSLAHCSFVPQALDIVTVGDQGVILMTSLQGLPLKSFHQLSDRDLYRLGRDLKTLHSVLADSFDGYGSWHQLLLSNTDRYIGVIAGPARKAAEKAYVAFQERIHDIPDSLLPTATYFDFREGNILCDDSGYSGIIDFESMRGGHPSMDFFKLLTYPSEMSDGELEALLAGYGAADWLDSVTQLKHLVACYAVYHGLAGLAWCSQRQQTDTEFYQRCARFLEQGR